jgi:hypothetical protein
MKTINLIKKLIKLEFRQDKISLSEITDSATAYLLLCDKKFKSVNDRLELAYHSRLMEICMLD